MFFPESRVRVFLCTQPADMRKSFTGLRALTVQVLQEDPLSGAVFVFINRRGTQLKSLYWDQSGFCIWSKRLEQGTFARGVGGGIKKELDMTQLKLLLEGIEVSALRRRKRFSLKSAA
jgi:transposase